jgi:hypothetical protein
VPFAGQPYRTASEAEVLSAAGRIDPYSPSKPGVRTTSPRRTLPIASATAGKPASHPGDLDADVTDRQGKPESLEPVRRTPA